MSHHGLTIQSGSHVYDEHGFKVEVQEVLKKGGYLVLNVKVDSETQVEYVAGKPYVLEQVYLQAPTAVIDARIATKRGELAALGEEIAKHRSELSELRKCEILRKSMAGQYEVLQHLENILQGNVCGYVMLCSRQGPSFTRVHKGKSGFIQPRCLDPGETSPGYLVGRCLTLNFGLTNPAQWQLHYGTSSSTGTQCIPCPTEKELIDTFKKELLAFVSNQDSIYSRRIENLCDHYGVPYPVEKVLQHYRNQLEADQKQLEQYDQNVANQQTKVVTLQATIKSLEAQAPAQA